VSLPHLLLVDDSEAILTYERAALAAHYAISTAANGQEAMERIEAIRPALVVLDLSMPVMDGEEVLRRCRADHRFADIPIVVVSAEHDRARRCLGLGAEAILPKPIRAEDLVALVGRVLEKVQARARERSLAVLEVVVGGVRMAIPLDSVRAVVAQLACRPLPFGPTYLHEQFELEEEAVDVLDVARRLGLGHVQSIVDRKLVVLDLPRRRALALAVDDVREPVEIPESSLVLGAQLGDERSGSLADVLVAMASTPVGPLPVIDPLALLAPDRSRILGRALCASPP
jgi:CheY-like chemotaxis protein/chemotaxis signal transduction protein